LCKRGGAKTKLDDKDTLQNKFATQELFHGKPLTAAQEYNSSLNKSELHLGKSLLQSYPRRIVFELTNSCNLSCVMCGRNYAEFSPSQLTINQFLWFKDLFHTIEEVTLMGWGEPTIHPDFSNMLKILDQYSVRKYLCTNGMLLGELEDAIFEHHVDLIAVSINGATAKTNNHLRIGSDLEKIVKYVKNITTRKKDRGSQWPHISFIYCLMKSNLHELLPCIVLAQQIGVNRVKVVYFTAFTKSLFNETVWEMEQEVQRVFKEAEKLSKCLGIELKLPHISGQDSADATPHHDCSIPWRDLFVGSDGMIRPCMSTSETMCSIDMKKGFLEIWNSDKFVFHRKNVNQIKSMPKSCVNCYQESICNWNLKKSFLQDENTYSPAWGKRCQSVIET
jgi:radical SAM protein with 4Fe4S-binding SPASM domain